MKSFSTIALFLLRLYATSAMRSLDMCANFVMETKEAAMLLHTPGYDKNLTYPADAYCRCDVYSLISSNQPRSLNVTILDLQLEFCAQAPGERYDTLDITTAHEFQSLYQTSILCGSSLPLSNVDNLVLSNDNGQLYGTDNTLFSLEFVRLEFRTDEAIDGRGVNLMLKSLAGMKVECQGVSGDLPTTTTTTTPSTTTTAKTYETHRFDKNKAQKKRLIIIIGATIGSIVVVFAIGLAIGVFIIIRKKKRAKRRSTPTVDDARRSSEGRPIYRDPCQGQPSIPLPGSIKVEVKDEYLHPKAGAVTPIYENPQAMGPEAKAFYENSEANGSAPRLNGSTEEVEYHGYIIPGSAPDSQLFDKMNGCESEPFRRLVMTQPKPPIPQPKKSKDKADVLAKKLSNESSDSQQPLLAERDSPHLGVRHDSSLPSINKSNDAIDEPALVKPSDWKKKEKLDKERSKPPPTAAKPAAKINNNSPPSTPPVKPAVKGKPHYRMAGQLPPPPPPVKPNKAASQTNNGESFQVVNVETTLS